MENEHEAPKRLDPEAREILEKAFWSAMRDTDLILNEDPTLIEALLFLKERGFAWMLFVWCLAQEPPAIDSRGITHDA